MRLFMNYRIAEIFYSIQSEGYNSGMPILDSRLKKQVNMKEFE